MQSKRRAEGQVLAETRPRWQIRPIRRAERPNGRGQDEEADACMSVCLRYQRPSQIQARPGSWMPNGRSRNTLPKVPQQHRAIRRAS